MKRLKAILISNRNYFIFYLFCLAIGLVFLLSVGKASSFIELNLYHRSALDTFFVWVTFLGDGRFAIAICLVYLVLRRWSRAFQLIAAFLISAGVAQILKNVFSMPRPKQFFSRQPILLFYRWGDPYRVCELSIRAFDFRIRPRHPARHL